MSDDLDIQSTPAGSDMSAPALDPAISGQPAAPSATQTGPAAAAPTQPASEGMVPSYRLREVRETAIRQAQEAFAQREAELTSRMEQVQRQLHALVGASPTENPEITAIRQQFSQLFPGLSKLEDRAADLLGLTDRSGELETQQKHYWQDYGRRNMDRLYSLAEKSLGGPLGPEGRQALHTSFVGFVSSSPAIAEMYTSDPTLVDEYWRLFASNFIDPVRRLTGATVQSGVANRALPQDTSAGIPGTAPPAKPANLDERVANAWASYQAHSTANKG